MDKMTQFSSQFSKLSSQLFDFSSNIRHRGRFNRLNKNLQWNELSHLRRRANLEIDQAPVVFTNSSVTWTRMVGWTWLWPLTSEKAILWIKLKLLLHLLKIRKIPKLLQNDMKHELLNPKLFCHEESFLLFGLETRLEGNVTIEY